MPYLLPDESFHSYLLRYYLRNGYGSEVLRTVLSNQGNWKHFHSLIIPEELKMLGDSVRFNLVRNSVSIGYSTVELDYDLLSYVITNSHKKFDFSLFSFRRVNHIGFYFYRAIRYCPICMKHSIRTHGVGYFKKSWLLQTNPGYCEEHNVHLQSINVIRPTLSIYQQLLEVLKGCDVKLIDYNDEIRTQHSWEDFFIHRLSNSSECLLVEIERFIRTFIKLVFSQCEVKLFKSEYLSAYRQVLTPSGAFKPHNQRNSFYLMKFIARNYSYDLRDFLSLKSREETRERKLSDGSTISYKTRIFVGARCSFCLLFDNKCLNSKRIPISNLSDVENQSERPYKQYNKSKQPYWDPSLIPNSVVW